jgi:hypothetical protein
MTMHCDQTFRLAGGVGTGCEKRLTSIYKGRADLPWRDQE